MRQLGPAAAILACALPAMAETAAPEASLLPEPRPARVDVSALALQPTSASLQSFADWRAGFRKRALAQGIRGDVFDRAFAGVVVDDGIVQRDRNQSEFVKQIWDYLDTAVSETRVENGRAALAKHAKALRRIEARYGVEKEIVVAVWGLETAYGAVRGDVPTVEALATLAYDPRRSRFFEAQLVAALRILQAGDVSASAMRGSWAGAMGHTQFMPESFLAYAQDFDGDGRRDIWADDPTDALASTAAYLAAHGWTRGQPWAVEVTLPKGFDYARVGKSIKQPSQAWEAMGVHSAHGGPLPRFARSSILLPAGHRGPAFLIYDNFRVIARYNNADAYVMGVGHLADRIGGAGAFRTSWPRQERALSPKERQELQRRLLVAGFDPQGADGIIGPRTIAAVRAFQTSIGWVPDGYASARLLERLRQQ